MLVDGVVEDHRIHGEGKGRREATLSFQHEDLKPLLSLGLPLRGKDETHAAAGHAAEHPKAPEISTKFGLALLNQTFGEVVGGPGNNGLQGLPKIARSGLANGVDVSASESINNFVEHPKRLLASRPFGGGAQEVFFGHHFENGAHVLGHASVDHYQ